MTDKERADLYAKALAAVIDEFSLVWHKPEERVAHMYDIAITALFAGTAP